MRYIPHTDQEIAEMLKESGYSSIEELFQAIPDNAKIKKELNLPAALSETELLRHVKDLGKKNRAVSDSLSFLGAGAYFHHVPAAVDEISSRSEWLTPYTPYQPEISQGTLQAIYEYQTMICNLTKMEVANASHYDGATATAEAALMAIGKTRRKTVVVASTLHPEYRDVIKTVLSPRDYQIVEAPFEESGQLNLNQLKELVTKDIAGVIVQSPNFLGTIEDLAAISQITHDAGALFIVSVAEPISLGILKAPGDFDADIVTGEGQAFGAGLNYGGPYLGLFATKEKLIRTMPGRITGQTVDKDGKNGFVLTFSTREQHIRRQKATSNICSNEALLATRAAIYLSLMGKQGLKKLAKVNFSNAEYLKSELTKLPGVTLAFNGPTFNEFVIKIDHDIDKITSNLLKKNIFAGVNIECWYRDLKNHLLICTTECHTKEDLDNFVNSLKIELTGA